MRAIQNILFGFALILIAISSNGQVNDQNIRKQVLEKNIVDRLFVFGKWTEKGGTETHLRYLGQLRTNRGQTFKIMNSIWFWGLSHRATSWILIFNEKKQYIGGYPLGNTSDLPDKLKNGKLIFTNNDNSDCDKNLKTTVNLTNGLPKQFFLKCKGEYGDIYTFSK